MWLDSAVLYLLVLGGPGLSLIDICLLAVEWFLIVFDWHSSSGCSVVLECVLLPFVFWVLGGSGLCLIVIRFLDVGDYGLCSIAICLLGVGWFWIVFYCHSSPGCWVVLDCV